MNTETTTARQPSAQHTPGPWVAHFGDNFTHRISGPGLDELAYLPLGIMNCDGDKEDDANARLIAAAPELLADLKRAEIVWTHAAKKGLAPEAGLLRIRETIAKAEGRA